MSYLNKLFIKQRKVEILFDEIKVVKKEYKNLSTFESDNPTDLAFSLQEILKTFRVAEYQKKKVKFLNFLDISYYRFQIDSFPYSLKLENNSFVCLDDNLLSGRIKTLERLINLCDYIIETGDEQAILQLKVLEHHLYGYLNAQERFQLSYNNHFFEGFITEIKKELKSKLASISNQLRSLFNTKYRSRNIRDLRQLFRNLMNLLFKNMDDEDCELNVLSLSGIKSFNFSQIYYPNGKERISPIFKDYIHKVNF